MRGYQLLKDGQMVYTFRSTVVTPDGREEHLTRAEVGRSGQVFTELAQFLVDQIEIGELDDTYKIVDLPDPDEARAVEQESATIVDYARMEPRDLMEMATERGLDVKGTGAGGNVLKSDVVNALKADDAREE